MDRQEYRSLLGRLPIKSPTAEDMAMMCPHLSPTEAVEALTTGSGHVACPPLRVDSAFQIIAYHSEWIERSLDKGVLVGTKNHPPTLRWAYAGRLGGTATYKHADSAIEFAKGNWSKDLTAVTWQDSVEIYVQDPADLVNDRYHRDYPRTKAVLYMVLGREWGQLQHGSKPQSVLIDEALVEMTLDQHVWHELQGGQSSYTEFNCAHCGSGLGLSGCPGCGHRFRDDQFRTGWNTPLSHKMVAFLRENGHQFAIDPQVAWDNERKWFAQHHQ